MEWRKRTRRPDQNDASALSAGHHCRRKHPWTVRGPVAAGRWHSRPALQRSESIPKVLRPLPVRWGATVVGPPTGDDLQREMLVTQAESPLLRRNARGRAVEMVPVDHRIGRGPAGDRASDDIDGVGRECGQ